MMPLFALMCGSHRFNPRQLAGFLHREHIFPRTWGSMSTKEKQAAKPEMKIAMLRWLRKRDSLQEAVDDIICNTKLENRSETCDNIWKGIRWYTEKPFQLFDLIMGGLAEGEINFTGTSAFPRWFNVDGRTGKLDALILNAAVSQTVILQSQPEYDSTSANRCAEGMRSVVYCIINESNKVIEFDRLDDKQTTFEVIPCQNLREIMVPHIADIESMSSSQQKNVLYSTLGLNNKELLEHLESQSEDLQLYLGTIIYWSRCEEREHHMSALILCIIKLCIQNLVEKDDTVPARSICHNISTCCSDADLQAISEAFKVVTTPERDELDMSILHGLSQLQACIQASQALNQLLRCPLPRMQLGQVYSGSLIYSLCCHLQSESEPDEYIRYLLGGSSELENIFKNLWKMFVNKY